MEGGIVVQVSAVTVSKPSSETAEPRTAGCRQVVVQLRLEPNDEICLTDDDNTQHWRQDDQFDSLVLEYMAGVHLFTCADPISSTHGVWVRDRIVHAESPRTSAPHYVHTCEGWKRSAEHRPFVAPPSRNASICSMVWLSITIRVYGATCHHGRHGLDRMMKA